MNHVEALEVFDYDVDTGLFYWRIRPSRKVRVGDVAGTAFCAGKKWWYVCIKYNKVPYLGHHLAWFWMTGKWPERGVDHRDGDGLNNAWSNLREATSAQNSQNLGLSARNKSGYTGVNWMKSRNKWRAEICVNRHSVHLGLFDTAEEAYAAYLAAKAELHLFQPTPREQLPHERTTPT